MYRPRGPRGPTVRLIFKLDVFPGPGGAHMRVRAGKAVRLLQISLGDLPICPNGDLIPFFSCRFGQIPDAGFPPTFVLLGPSVKGLQKVIKDLRGAIKSPHRAIKSAQRAIKSPRERSGAPRDLFSHWQRSWQDLRSHPSTTSTRGCSREIFGAVRRVLSFI